MSKKDTLVDSVVPGGLTQAVSADAHPLEGLLRMERIPHIWCPGCGIGTVVNAFLIALDKSKVTLDKTCLVSGIGCTARIPGYIRLDGFHCTHGRAIPFATGLKLANPDLKVIVLSGDGDLISIGGNHFIHAARRNMDITVLCVNNFNYGMTGGQVAPTTPLGANTSTTPYGNAEQPFVLPYLAESCGAVYVARWTALDVRRLSQAMTEAILKKGFSFVEIIAPCVSLYARRNRLGEGKDLLRFYHDNAVIKNGASTKDLAIDFQKPFVLGKFVDRERPTFDDQLRAHFSAVLGDKYVPYAPSAERSV
jgi:2-oxoglutarate ferredoxin oxidoreductase subunit beta